MMRCEQSINYRYNTQASPPCKVAAVSTVSRPYLDIFFPSYSSLKGHLSRRSSVGGVGLATWGDAAKRRSRIEEVACRKQTCFPYLQCSFPAAAFQNNMTPPSQMDRTRPARLKARTKSLCTPRVHRPRRVVLRYTVVHFTIAWRTFALYPR